MAASLMHKAQGSRVAVAARRPTASRVALRQLSLRPNVIVRADQVKAEPGVASVTDSNWSSEVLESDMPVVVDFWAPWCGPCRFIAPIIDELAADYTGKAKFFKLNTDENSKTATELGIRSIPTVIIFKSGEKKETVIGAVQKSVLSQTIDKYL